MNPFRSGRLACGLLCVAVISGGVGTARGAQATREEAIAQDQVQFELYLPLQNRDALTALVEAQHTPGSPQFHKWITPGQFRSQYGPSQSDIDWATDVLGTYNLTVSAVHSHGLTVVGKSTDVEKALNVNLEPYTPPAGHPTLVADRLPTLPSGLSSTGAQVVDISSFPLAEPQSMSLGVEPANRTSLTGPYWPDDLKQAYDFPSYQALNGAGATIGIVISADFSDADMTYFFGQMGLPVPNITRVPILGGGVFNPNFGVSGEVTLDVQQSGGIAPGANIRLYSLPSLSFNAIFVAYNTIVEENIADVVTSSFGAAESEFLPQCFGPGECFDFEYILAMFDDVFLQGSAQGISFVAASGDFGALQYLRRYRFQGPRFPPLPYQQSPDWPADDPYVVGVGGTNLVTTYSPGSLDSAYLFENAYYNDSVRDTPSTIGWGSGGGLSRVFLRPSYQEFTGTGYNCRTVPDVSGHMGCCVFAGFQYRRSTDYMRLGGLNYRVIGTSASSPDFAGLLALKIQYLCGTNAPNCTAFRLGVENFDIYQLGYEQQVDPSLDIFHNDIPGSNGYFFSGSAGWPFKAGYNLVLGNGTVDARRFIGDLNDPPAGIPHTPSNP